MDEIILRKATISDIDQLQKISRQTFFETFSGANTSENMQNYLQQAFSTTRLTAELNDNNSSFYLAVLNNELIGYLKLNSGQSQTELQDREAIEIERIYVLQEFHGKNIGQLLYDKALDVARKQGAGYLWLGVWEENPRAIRFYKKNGFVEFDRHLFRLGDSEQTDIMMKKEL